MPAAAPAVARCSRVFAAAETERRKTAMCGITGIYSLRESIDPAVLSSMTDALSHRGPDDSGTYVSGDGKVGLGHRRLSIIDLSERGRQPMASDDGRIQVSYNGEIYNYRELREELRSRGHVFRTDCDTEVLIRSYEEWGIECLHRFVGMFAFAIWDGRENRLYLARDRVGVKPLYYYMQDGLFLFASELKSMTRHPGFPGRISPDGLALFLRYDYVRSPYTIYENTFKLEPGHYLCLEGGELEKHRYWDITEFWNMEPYDMDEDEAADMFEELMADSIRHRLVSDVPVGLFLSGGIDSSVVAAMLRDHVSAPFKTFTIGFDDRRYDEAAWAKKIAGHLGTEHVEAYVSEEEAADMVFDIPSVYDEPFADSSSIPTCAVSRLASEHVKVVMSADGGDELFCGYNNYIKCMRYANAVAKVPRAVRKGLRAALSGFGVGGFEVLAKIPGLSPLRKFGGVYERDRAMVLAIIDGDMAEMNRYRRGIWAPRDMPGVFGRSGGAHQETFEEDFASVRSGDLLSRMLYGDFRVWLPDDILTKVDKASMSVGLEARVPLLDHRFVSFAAKLPMDLKYRDGETKYLMKKVLSRRLPEELYSRPKKGFSAPIDRWLRGRLRPLVDEYLGESAVRRSGVFDPAEVSLWKERFYERFSVGPRQIWNLLMFQMWHEKWH